MTVLPMHAARQKPFINNSVTAMWPPTREGLDGVKQR